VAQLLIKKGIWHTTGERGLHKMAGNWGEKPAYAFIFFTQQLGQDRGMGRFTVFVLTISPQGLRSKEIILPAG
jgi:hypothetical protein